jgi:hypothetical protein
MRDDPEPAQTSKNIAQRRRVASEQTKKKPPKDEHLENQPEPTGKLENPKMSSFIQDVKRRFLPAQCNDNSDDDGKDAAADLLFHS